MSGRGAVFLDRDGVLIATTEDGGVPRPAARLEDVAVLPGAAEACAELRRAGLLLICVSNQPDIARGRADRATVAAINDLLLQRLGLDDVLVCPHDDADGCACRKPLPGMLHDAAQRWSIDLDRSVMVGDRWRDVDAGRRAGCRTVFIDHHYLERRPASPDHVAPSLAGAVEWILAAVGSTVHASKEGR